MRSVNRLRNPRALYAKPMYEFWLRALEKSRFADGDLPKAIDAFVEVIAHPDSGVFIGYEDYQPKGLFILSPSFPLFPIPQVWHAYNEGSPALSREMFAKGVEFLRAKGYTKCHAMNGPAIASEKWLRVFRLRGRSRPIATAYEIDLT